MKIVYSRKALGDLETIADYIRARSPSGAASVRTVIRSAVVRLGAHPLSGRLQEDGSRKIVTRRYGYLIYYDVRDQRVEILAVRHGARRPVTYNA